MDNAKSTSAIKIKPTRAGKTLLRGKPAKAIKLKRLPPLRSFILYTGPSMLDGSPIVVIGTTRSSNTKTGDMFQTWIMSADTAPHIAAKTGADASVCGDCPHRTKTITVTKRYRNGKITNSKKRVRACYVILHNAPLSAYRAWARRGKPAAADHSRLAAIGAGKQIRLGAYGDPAAVPPSVWRALLSNAAPGNTGYTHQWQGLGVALRDLCMASVDSEAERDLAHARGLRTFRGVPAGGKLGSNEIWCPNETHGTQCADCGLCDGATPGDKRPSIAVSVHGNGKKYFLPMAT